MELDSCHFPVAYNFGLVPRFLESLCTPALCSYSPFQHCAPTRWKAVTLSVTERKSLVSSDVTMPSVTIKKNPVYKWRVRRHSWIHSSVHSVIHLTNFVMAIHGLTVKQEDKFPTTATQPVLQTLTATDALSFRKYQGMWHMMYSRQRGDTLYHCSTCRLRGTRYSNTLRWTNLLYGINRDKGMWLWKSTLKPEIYSDDATYLQIRNSERWRGEFKGTRWKHHVMKTGPNIYTVKWTLHKPGWLCNNINKRNIISKAGILFVCYQSKFSIPRKIVFSAFIT